MRKGGGGKYKIIGLKETVVIHPPFLVKIDHCEITSIIIPFQGRVSLLFHHGLILGIMLYKFGEGYPLITIDFDPHTLGKKVSALPVDALVDRYIGSSSISKPHKFPYDSPYILVENIHEISSIPTQDY
jgi:hypothetical protein